MLALEIGHHVPKLEGVSGKCMRSNRESVAGQSSIQRAFSTAVFAVEGTGPLRASD